MNYNKKSSINKKRNLDDSAQVNFNRDMNKNSSIKQINKRKLTNDKNHAHNRKSKALFEKEGKISRAKLIYYYLLPLCILRRKKGFNNIYCIKDKICKYFSIETLNELIKFKEKIEDDSFKTKMKSVELLTLNNNYDKNSFDDGKNKNG
jgi:hypothetical protein